MFFAELTQFFKWCGKVADPPPT